MNINNTYEEIYEVLNHMNKVTVMKIPIEILNEIKNQRNKDFKTKIDKNDIFNENNISKETADILCWLEYTYWMDDSQKKEIDELHKNILIQKEEKKELNIIQMIYLKIIRQLI